MAGTKLLPLPQTAGPKLGPFRPGSDRKQSNGVRFISRLGEGLHAYVLKASIGGQEYALKVFKFFEPWEYWPTSGNKRIPEDTDLHVAHRDPFYSECRAYARLKELGREHAAARCYGYVLLSAEEEHTLQQMVGNKRFKRPEYWAGKPVHCLVKELLPSDPQFTPRMIPGMMRDLRLLNRSGIVVFDIKEDAYLGGKLVDFSQAKTVPHVDLDIELNGEWEVLSTVRADFICFDQIIDDWNRQHPMEKIWCRFFPGFEKVRGLRNVKEIKAFWADPPLPKIMVHLYDWQKQGTSKDDGGKGKNRGKRKKRGVDAVASARVNGASKKARLSGTKEEATATKSKRRPAR